jgi:hypothetical protein
VRNIVLVSGLRAMAVSLLLQAGCYLSHEVSASRAPLQHVAQVAAGAYFGCVRLADGRVACWGEGGDDDLLGDGVVRRPFPGTSAWPVFVVDVHDATVPKETSEPAT